MTRDPDGGDHPSALDLVAAMPFAVLLGVEATSASPEEVRGRLRWRPEICTTGGVLHGGALISLADSLGAISGSSLRAGLSRAARAVCAAPTGQSAFVLPEL
jgi:acyl-coenzyme A thioesterase PaaI-like protein